jgi:Trk-type K+ transport system membrane component
MSKILNSMQSFFEDPEMRVLVALIAIIVGVCLFEWFINSKP